MEKSIVIHGEKILQKFQEALLEYIEAEGDLPETISVVAEGTQKELGQNNRQTAEQTGYYFRRL